MINGMNSNSTQNFGPRPKPRPNPLRTVPQPKVLNPLRHVGQLFLVLAALMLPTLLGGVFGWWLQVVFPVSLNLALILSLVGVLFGCFITAYWFITPLK